MMRTKVRRTVKAAIVSIKRVGFFVSRLVKEKSKGAPGSEVKSLAWMKVKVNLGGHRGALQLLYQGGGFVDRNN